MSKLTDLEENDFFTELTPEEAADLKGGFSWGDLWKDAWGVYGATAGGVAGFVLGAPLSPVGQAATSGAGAAVSQYTREAISQSSTASGAVIVRYRALRTLGDWARSRNALPAELATHRSGDRHPEGARSEDYAAGYQNFLKFSRNLELPS